MAPGPLAAALSSIVLLGALACAGPVREGRGASSEAASSPSPYFGQPAPGLVPERFAPGVVSTDAIELNGVFTPDLREFFFTRQIDGVDTIHRSVLENGTWSAPRPLLLFPGQVAALAVDMAVSPDGQHLYFLGQHAHEHATGEPGYDLWVSRREAGTWSTARVVPPPVSTAAREIYPVVVADGSLYFISDRDRDDGRSDLYRAQRLPGGDFAEPRKLDPPINGPFGIGDTYVAPDERYMVLSSRRLPSSGLSDLFVSFRLDDGRWSDPVNLGSDVNTEEVEFCPMVTPDGKYLFFSRRWGSTWEETTAGDVYWVDARIVDRFRP